VARYCEESNGHICLTKDREFNDYMRHNQILKKDLAPRSYVRHNESVQTIIVKVSPTQVCRNQETMVYKQTMKQTGS